MLETFEEMNVEHGVLVVLVVLEILDLQTRMVSKKTLGDFLELFLSGDDILLPKCEVLTGELLHCVEENAFPRVVRHTNRPFF